MHNVQIFALLLVWALSSTIYIIIHQTSLTFCPYKWHGGSPSHKGSCWCGGLDNYCMCTPSLAIDAIIEISTKKGPSVVLVRRRDPPRKYAIPGGFVDIGETVEKATMREVQEETNLHPTQLEQFSVYSKPDRDQRRHTVSVVFRCIAENTEKISAGDDAKSVEIIPLMEIKEIDLAFDHSQILKDYIAKYHPNLYK
eukprot:gene13224-27983_t